MPLTPEELSKIQLHIKLVLKLSQCPVCDTYLGRDNIEIENETFQDITYDSTKKSQMFRLNCGHCGYIMHFAYKALK